MRLPILRSSPEDQVLYQTERYNEDTFGYEVPIREEGDYILVMKYAEVYFAQSQQKVTEPQLVLTAGLDLLVCLVPAEPEPPGISALIPSPATLLACSLLRVNVQGERVAQAASPSARAGDVQSV